MARVIKEGVRMVFTGSDTQPTGMRVEYQIIDSDMVEPPERIRFEETNFDIATQSLWSDTLAQVRTAESL